MYSGVRSEHPPQDYWSLCGDGGTVLPFKFPEGLEGSCARRGMGEGRWDYGLCWYHGVITDTLVDSIFFLCNKSSLAHYWSIYLLKLIPTSCQY